jgi:pectate lyase
VTPVLILALTMAVVGASPGAAQEPLPAFPGAEGFGAVATGGRGGDVVVVTTLEATGEGSLGAALDPDVCRPRIVVFRVSGVIEGDLDLACGDLTIAGQTAPGAGITIRGRIDGYDASPGGNLIIRHIRVRPGPAEPGTGHLHDAIQLSNNPRVILDHVSASWGTDEVIDLFEGSGDITIQWSTVEESRIDGHPDGPHNKGLIIGPGVRRASVHHVLFAHHRDRCPAIASGPAEVIGVVAYDCKDGFVHHNPADGEFHLVGTTHRRGPNVEPGRFVPLFFDDEDPGGTT